MIEYTGRAFPSPPYNTIVRRARNPNLLLSVRDLRHSFVKPKGDRDRFEVALREIGSSSPYQVANRTILPPTRTITT
jgi:hypothetical protein